MLHTTQRRTLTPPAALQFFDGVNDVSTRARLLKEKQESHLAHVGTRLDTRRSKEDTGDVRERALRRLVQQQKLLSPRRTAETTEPRGDQTPSPPASPACAAKQAGSPATSPSRQTKAADVAPPSPHDDVESEFDPTADPAQLVAVGGVNAHFLSCVNEPVPGEIAQDPFAALQLHALTTDPRSLGGRKPAEMAGRNKAELRTTEVDATHRSRPLHRKQFNGIERHGRIKDQPLDFVASTNLNLRSPREVPVSAYVSTQLKALRYSMKVGGTYHEEFMRHADSVEEAVVQRKAESRRKAAVDFVESNRQATAGSAEEKLVARQKRAGLVEQRKHVEDAALDAWFDRIRGTDLSSRGATSPKSNLSPAKRMLQSLRSPSKRSDPLALSANDDDTVEEDDVHTLRAKKLITMVALGRIAHTLTESLQAAWLERAAEMRRRQMQIVYCGGMSMKEVHRAWNNVRRQLRVYIQRFKQRKYAEPANLVRRFMVHHRRVSAMTDAVKWYRANVIRCQRQVRAYIIMKRARHTLLSLQWAAREAELLSQTWPWDMNARARAATQNRFGGIPGSFTILEVPMTAASVAPPAAGAVAAGERAAVLHLIWAAPGGCSIDIRMSVVTALVSAAIRDRRREMRRYEHKDRFYQTQLANWKTLHARGVKTAAPAPPEQPTGMLFLPRAALYGHINRGQSDTANANGGVMPSQQPGSSGVLSPSVPTGTTPRPSDNADDRPPPLLTPKALVDNNNAASGLTPQGAAASASFTSSTPTPSAASKVAAAKRTPRGVGMRRRRSSTVTKRVVPRSQSRADSDVAAAGGGGGTSEASVGGDSSMPSLKSPALKAVNFSFSHGKPGPASDAKSPGESLALTPRAETDDGSVPSPAASQLLPSSALAGGGAFPASASVRTAAPSETPSSAASTAKPALKQQPVPAPPCRKPSSRQRPVPAVVTVAKPRSDAYYARLLGQPDVPEMEAFLRRDDRTGDRMRTAYIDQHRVASPVAAKSSEIAKVAEQRTRDASHDPFRSEMVDRLGVRPVDPPPPGPVELQALPITTMAFASVTAPSTAPSPRVAGSEHSPRSARRAPPASGRSQPQFAATARRPPMASSGSSQQQQQQRPRALSPPSAMAIRGRTADVGVRLPVVPASRLASSDPVPASDGHPSRRLLSRGSQRSRGEGARRSAPATFEADILKAEAGGAVQFLMAAADVHTESHRPKAHFAV